MSSDSDGSREIISCNSSFSTIIDKAISNPDYLVGAEPEGSDWDFSDWTGFDFTGVNYNGYGILGEKFFHIPTIDDKVLTMRIIKTDPKVVPTMDKKLRVNYIVGCADRSLGFPTIVVAIDADGQERILTQELSVDMGRVLTDYFSNIKRNNLVEDYDAGWANFLKDVLASRQFLPTLYEPPDEIVRDQLDLSSSDSIGIKERLAAELELVNQEVLGILYADFIASEGNL